MDVAAYPEPTQADIERIRGMLVGLVCTVENFPPRLDSSSFRDLVKALNPSGSCLPIMDFEPLKQGCLKYYQQERIKTQHVLKNRDGLIGLTVETLRCYDIFLTFACVRAHFIDDDWNHKGWVLRFQNIDGCALVTAVQKSIKSWGIADKVLTVTFQGYHYDPDTFDEEIKSCIQSHKQPELDGQLLHGFCCADLFRKMSRAAYGAIDGTISKLKWFISFPRVDHYWSVINSSLKEALDLKSMGEITREIVGDADWPSDEEWKKVEQVYELAEMLFNSAKVIFVRKYAISSTFLIGLNDLREGLNTAASSSCSFTSETAKKILLKLDKYWKRMFPVLALAAVMDPRCKMVYIEFLSSKSEYCHQPTVLETVHSLYGKYAAANTVNVKHENPVLKTNPMDVDAEVREDPGSEEDEYETPVPISSHLHDFQEFAQTTIRAPKSDLDWYLEEPVISWDDNFDLLAWWRTQSPKYPTLSKMARDILSIQFSVLKSDDVYYNEEREVDKNLLSAGPLLMNALMCTRSWHQKKSPT